MSAVRPIKPGEVIKQKKVDFPDAVFAAFNQLIAKNFYSGFATVKQKEVIELLVRGGFNEKEVYANHWLDVEEMYRSAGWSVKYDKPAYCEEWFEPYFEFSKK